MPSPRLHSTLRTLVLTGAFLLTLPLRATEAAAPSPAVAAADAKLFDYDRGAPLDLKELGRETRDGALIRDVTFVGVKDSIKAYIVAPLTVGVGETSAASHAGILFTHWLGNPTTTNRTEFLNEAVALANQGIVSVLVDAMWATPKWYPNRIPEEDFDHAIRQVIELRRAMDLLLAQTGVDAKRIAYVGHDFGAMYGVLFGAVDRRASTYVLMTGIPHFIDWFLFSRQPKDLAAYRAQLAPLDPVRFVPQLAPTPIFFQFASHDEYVSAAAAAEFYAAAGPRKQTATYDAGHDLHNADASADRITWLLRELAPKR